MFKRILWFVKYSGVFFFIANENTFVFYLVYLCLITTYLRCF